MQTTHTTLHPPPTQRPELQIIQPSAFWWFCPGLMGFHFTQDQSSAKILQDCLQISSHSLSLSPPSLLMMLYCKFLASFLYSQSLLLRSTGEPLSTLSILLPAPWPEVAVDSKLGQHLGLPCVFPVLCYLQSLWKQCHIFCLIFYLFHYGRKILVQLNLHERKYMSNLFFIISPRISTRTI